MGVAYHSIMSRRRRRWLVGVLVALLVLTGGLWISYRAVLPRIVRSQVVSALAGLGISNVSFDLRQATLWATDLSDVRGDGGDVAVSGIEVRYAPLDAIRGNLDSILLSGARLTIDLDHPRTFTPPSAEPSGSADLPFGRLDLKSSTLVLKRRSRELEIPVDGSLVRGASGSAALRLISSISSAPLSIAGSINPSNKTIDISANAANVQLSVLRELLPAEVATAIKSAGGTVDASARFTRTDGRSLLVAQLALEGLSFETTPDMGVAADDINATITFDNLLELKTAPSQRIDIGSIRIGEQQLRDAVFAFNIHADHGIQVGHIEFNWAGGEVRADPFTIDPSHPVIDTTVIVQRVHLQDAVAVLTGGRATGDGTVSGAVPIRVDWPTSVTFGDGFLRADGSGNLRLGDATNKFGQLLEKSNPRFASDPTLGELKTDILDAVQNFDFHLLEVRFHKTGTEQSAMIKLYGRGNSGARVPVNLGLNVYWNEQDVADYLKAQSRVLSSMSGKAANP